MKIHFVIALADGSIVRGGECDEEIIDQQPLLEGETLIVGHGHSSTHYVAGGQIRAYTPEQREARSTFPPYPARWDNTLMRWVDLRDLETIRTAAWEEIKRRREQAFAARAVSPNGVAYSITADKANLADRLASLDAAISLGAATETTTIQWRDRDNVAHELSIIGLRVLAAAMGARGQAIYERSWALDAQVKAATSSGQLVAIDLEAGWP